MSLEPDPINPKAAATSICVMALGVFLLFLIIIFWVV